MNAAWFRLEAGYGDRIEPGKQAAKSPLFGPLNPLESPDNTTEDTQSRWRNSMTCVMSLFIETYHAVREVVCCMCGGSILELSQMHIETTEACSTGFVRQFWPYSVTGFEAILRLPQADSTLSHRIDVLPIRTRMNRIKDTRPMRPTAQSNYLVGLRETHAWRKRCEQNQNIMEHGFLNKLQLCSHTWHHAPRSSWLCLIRQTIQPKCRASPRPNP